MVFGGEEQPSALVALAEVAAALRRAEHGRGVPIVQMLLRAGDELPWGTGEGLPAEGVLEFWAEIEPGVTRDELESELRDVIDDARDGVALEWEQRTRFLPATELPSDAPIVAAVQRALGAEGSSVAPFACDAFMFNEHSSTPVAVCGPGGGNAHAPDEYVHVGDLHALATAYVRLALDWCGQEKP